MLKKIIPVLIKHRERAAMIGLGLGLVVFIGLGIYLQKTNSKEKQQIVEKAPVKVELHISPQSQGDHQGAGKKTGSFFLRPSPAELLEQLSEMENLQEDVAQKKLQYLRVLWPVYFFSVEPGEKDSTLLLDISEDGFGVVVRGAVNPNVYPELQELAVGDKIWVAGEIAAVDPEGTGTVYLNIELLDFTEDGPPSAKIAEETQKE